MKRTRKIGILQDKIHVTPAVGMISNRPNDKREYDEVKTLLQLRLICTEETRF